MLLCTPAGFAQFKEPPKKPKDTQTTEVGGKDIDQWIKEIGHKDPSRQTQAIYSVLGFGPDKASQAVPAMLAELKKHTPEYPIDASVRHNLVLSVGMILSEYKDKKGNMLAEEKDFRDSIASFKRLLKDREVMVRYRAAQALGSFGTRARSAVPELLVLTKDPATWETRQAACEALGSVAEESEDKGPDVKVITTLYLVAFKDKAMQVQMAAIKALTDLGAPKEMQIKSDLIKYLDMIATKKDGEPMVKMWAHMAVMSISHNITETRLTAIMEIAVKSERVDARIQACQALGIIGMDSKTQGQARTQAPALVKMLSDRDPGVVNWAIWALIHMESQLALPAMEKMVAGPKETKIQTFQALGSIGPKASPMAPAIMRCLTDADSGVVYWAMWALVNTEAVSALPNLEAMAVSSALPERMKKDAKDAAAELTKKMKNNPKVK